MSIATVVTMGYGSFGSVNLLPTLGYGIGAAESVTGVGLEARFTDRRLHGRAEDRRLHGAVTDKRLHGRYVGPS